MKITFYAYPKVYGGLIKHIELLKEGLQAKHHVNLIIPENLKQNIRCDEAPLDRFALDHHVVKGKFDWGGFFRLYHFLKRSKPDIFHVHLASPGESTLPFLASRLAGIPVIIATEHSPSYFPLERFYSVRVKNFCQRFIDRIIALSESGQHILVHKFGINPKKISVVYNGVNIVERNSEEAQRETRQKLGIKEGSTVVVTISEITEKKGIGVLLQAAEQFIKKEAPVHFLIIGEGHLRDTFQSHYGSYIEERHMIFTGYQEDVKPYLSISDLFVLPSFGEEIPFSLLEAMAARIPVVSTAVGGIPEIIKHAESGWLVKPNDANDLFSGIMQVMQDKTVAQALSRNAFHLIETKFSLSTMIDLTERIYRSLLANKLGRFDDKNRN